MTGLLRSLAVAAGLLVGLALPAAADAGYATTTGAVNLRAGAGAGYARLATIPAGDRLWVEFCKAKWCRVVWRKVNGWVAAAYLDFGYAPSAPAYDYYYDEFYDYGLYPHRRHHHHHHKPPHCSPGDECKPPKPWPKPDKPPVWHQAPKWEHQAPKWEHSAPKFDSSTTGKEPHWQGRFEHREVVPDGNREFKSDRPSGDGGKKKWDDK